MLLWLKQRNVWAEHATLADLTIRRDLIADVLAENSAHVMYEISRDGTAIRMDALVFPHPRCSCEKINYIAPTSIAKNINYAFSLSLKSIAPVLELQMEISGLPV